MHHAYLFEGPLSVLEALTHSAREAFGFATDTHNPDVHIYEWEKLNIEDARMLSQEAQFKHVSERALYILGAGSISHDAQQALLKLFEEPQAGMVFVLLVPPGTLISTLRSRFTEYPHKVEAAALSLTPAKKFLASTYKERSAQAAALIKEEEGAKERVREFVALLEQVLYAAHAKKQSAELREALEDIALVRNYLGDRSASMKMLVEHLAVTLPVL